MMAGHSQQQQRLATIVMRAAPEGKQPSSSDAAAADDDADFEGLLPEEDVEVPGTYFDALNKNTKLGKAVAAAIDELEHLGGMVRFVGGCYSSCFASCFVVACASHHHSALLSVSLNLNAMHVHTRPQRTQEREALNQAEELLGKLGIKGAVFKGVPPAAAPEGTSDDAVAPPAADKQ